MIEPFLGSESVAAPHHAEGFMDPDTAGLRQRLDRASHVLDFAEAAGDESASRIAGVVLAELLDQAERHGIEPAPRTFPAARPGPRTKTRPA